MNSALLGILEGRRTISTGRTDADDRGDTARLLHLQGCNRSVHGGIFRDAGEDFLWGWGLRFHPDWSASTNVSEGKAGHAGTGREHAFSQEPSWLAPTAAVASS